MWAYAILAQCCIEKDVRGGSGAGCHLSSFEIADLLDTHIRMAPQLGGCVFHVIDQKYLSPAYGGIVRDDGAGHQHIEAAGSHCPKCLDSILKFNKLHFQILALPESHRACERKLAVDCNSVHVPGNHFVAPCKSPHSTSCRKASSACEFKKRAAAHRASPSLITKGASVETLIRLSMQ